MCSQLTFLKALQTNKQQQGELPAEAMVKCTSKLVTVLDCVDGHRGQGPNKECISIPHQVLKTGSLQARRINPLLLQRKQLKFKLPRVPNRTSCEFMLVCSKSRVPRGTGQKQSSILRFKKSSLNNCPREMDRPQSRRSSGRGNKEPGKTQQKQYTVEHTHKHLGQWDCHHA